MDDTGAINRSHCRVTQRTIITRDCTYGPFPAPNIVLLCFITSTFPAHPEQGLLRAPRPTAPSRHAPPRCRVQPSRDRGTYRYPQRVVKECSGEECPPQASQELARELTTIIQNGFRNRVQKTHEVDPDRNICNRT